MLVLGVNQTRDVSLNTSVVTHQDGFQQQQNVVNVIFGGDASFSKRAQKLLLREILSVEPAI